MALKEILDGLPLVDSSSNPLGREYALLVSDHHWVVLFASQAIVLLLNPIAW